jgi:tetratricopeptide (TPR) repeat protein
VAFHPEGQLLATAGQDGTFCLWAIASGAAIAQFGEAGRDENQVTEPDRKRDRPAAATITRLAFSPDGRRLAAANPQRPLEIWDVAAGRVALVLDWDGEGVSSAAWSADGQRLAATFGKRVKVWDATERSVEVRRQATEGSAVDWHQNEAKWAKDRWDWYAAEYHLTQLIKAEPANALHRVKRGAARACLVEADRSHLEDAGTDIAKAIELDPGNLEAWYQHALLALATGHRDRYRTICEDILARFGQSDEPSDANLVAWTCSLAPGAVADPLRPVELASRAQAREPTSVIYLNTLGVALYRAGQFEAARERLTKSAATRKPMGDAWDWLYLAMIHHRLGQSDLARRWFDRAIRALDHTATDQPPPGAASPPSWDERLELQLLRQEATALLQAK